MDIKYFMQILLFILIFIGIHYASYRRQTQQYEFINILLKEERSFLYSHSSKHIEKKHISVFDKYQIWRYIERRKTSSFIKINKIIKENTINGDIITTF
jgi:hypothetical protein